MISRRLEDLRDDNSFEWGVTSHEDEHTDDTDLEVIAGTTKENLLLLGRCLFWRHPLFTGGKCCRRERKGSTSGKREAGAWGPATEETEEAQSISHINHFQKKSHGWRQQQPVPPPVVRSHNSTHSPAYPLTLGRAGCFTTPLYPPSTMKTFKNAVLFILSLTMAVKSQQLVTTTNACVSH